MYCSTTITTDCTEQIYSISGVEKEKRKKKNKTVESLDKKTKHFEIIENNDH